MAVALAGEGPTDLAIMRKLMAEAALDAGDVLWGEGRTTGKPGLLQRLRGYAAGARDGRAFFVLFDLDQDAPCASGRVQALGVAADPHLCLRIAVRAAEAWLIADRAALAEHLAAPVRRLGGDPDTLPDPKRTIIDACAHSRRKQIRNGIQPRPRAGRAEGPDYVDILADFVARTWSPERAAGVSDSLARSRRALARLRGLGG